MSPSNDIIAYSGRADNKTTVCVFFNSVRLYSKCQLTVSRVCDLLDGGATIQNTHTDRKRRSVVAAVISEIGKC